MRTTSTAENEFVPPGRNCGACGCRTCDEYVQRTYAGTLEKEACPFYHEVSENTVPVLREEHRYSGIDVVGQAYDYVITSLPGEPSARKIILPFRSDSVERMGIVPGDVVVGRPAGAGCPVNHVMKVIDADPDTGVITGHVLGPALSRGCFGNVKEVKRYHMLGFEGRAIPITKEPEFGLRQHFLPGFCMMDRAHTGLCNMVIDKPWGIHVRVEDVVIL